MDKGLCWKCLSASAVAFRLPHAPEPALKPPWGLHPGCRAAPQALLALINSRRPMGTEALSAPPLPKLMVGADEAPK